LFQTTHLNVLPEYIGSVSEQNVIVIPSGLCSEVSQAADGPSVVNRAGANARDRFGGLEKRHPAEISRVT
jgi:hypothetical protein